MPNLEKPRFFLIDGKTYDFSAFVSKHPGGDEMLLFEGIDSSVHYKMLHNKEFDHEKMKKYLFKDGKPEVGSDTTKVSEFGLAIIKAVRDELGNISYFANYIYYVKSTILLMISFLLEYLYITGGGCFVSLALGVSFASLGLNVHHDATHGALGPHKWYHNIFKFTADWFGASKILWQ